MTTTATGAPWLDLFPAEAQLPDGRFFRRARVVATDDRVVVWAEDTSTPPVIDKVCDQRIYAHVERPNAVAPIRRQRAVIATDAGTLTANRVGTCRCGGLLSVNVRAEFG